MNNVVIAGYLGYDNCGDEAMLAGTIRRLRALNPDVRITVLSANPAATAALHGVNALPSLPDGPLAWPKSLLRPRRWATLSALRRADATLWLAGSGIFSDTRGLTIDRFWPLFRLMRGLSRRFIFLSASAGPIEHPRTPAYVRAIARHSDAIGTRDSASCRLMREVCAGLGDRILPMSDMALHLEPEQGDTLKTLLADASLSPDTPCLGVCIPAFFQTPRDVPHCEEYRHQFTGALAEALDRFASTHGIHPVFLPFQSGPDAAMAESVATQMRTRSSVLRQSLTPGAMLALMGELRLVLGMRLHAVILAALAGTPVVSIVYDEKIRGFLEDIGQSPLSIDYRIWQRERAPLDTEALLSLLTRADQEREAITHDLRQAIDRLRTANDEGIGQLRQRDLL